MDYLAKGDDLFGFDDSIGNQIGQWQDALERIRNASDVLVNTDKIKGHTADRMKEYFSGVYGSIQATLNALLADYSLKWGQYLADYTDLDSDAHFVISTSELESINAEHMAQNSEKGYVEQCVYNAVASVSDISSAVFDGLNYINNQHNSIESQLDKLGSDVAQIESTHSQSDFVNIDASIQSVSALIAEMSSKDTIYKLNFDGAAFSTSAAYQKLANCYNQLASDVRDNGKQFERIQSTRAQRAEQLTAEAEERKKQAETVKTITMGVCIVGGLAATVLTAGAASPILVATISGGVTGAVMAGVNTGADMYAAGGWSNLDWSKIGQEALIGGIVGAATGAVTGALGGSFEGAKTLGTKIVSNTITKIASGATERATNTLLHDVFDGKSLGETALDTLKNTLDMRQIGKDAISGSVKTLAGEGIDKVLGKGNNEIMEKIGDHALIKKSLDAMQGALKETGGGMASRFTSTLIVEDEKSDKSRFQQALDSTFDKKSITTDAIGGGGSVVAKDVLKDRQIEVDKKLTTKKMRNNALEDAHNKAKQYNEDGNGKNAIKFIEERTGVKGVERSPQSGNLDYTNSGKIVTVDGKPAVIKRLKMSGNENIDIDNATKQYKSELGSNSDWVKPKDTVWHHGKDLMIDENGDCYTEMQLVPDNIHNYYPKHAGTNKQYEYYNSSLESRYKGLIVDSSKKAMAKTKGFGDYKEETKSTVWKAPAVTLVMPSL